MDVRTLEEEIRERPSQMSDNKEVKLKAVYGLNCLNPNVQAVLVAPPPPTLRDWVVGIWIELIWPSLVCGFLAAITITLLK